MEAGTAGLRRKARPWEIAVDDFFDDLEALRATRAELPGAGPNSLAIPPSVGYGLSLAANNGAPGAGQGAHLLNERHLPGLPGTGCDGWRSRPEMHRALRSLLSRTVAVPGASRGESRGWSARLAFRRAGARILCWA